MGTKPYYTLTNYHVLKKSINFVYQLHVIRTKCIYERVSNSLKFGYRFKTRL